MVEKIVLTGELDRTAVSERVSMVDLRSFIEELIVKANEHALTEKDALMIEEGIREGIADAVSEAGEVYRNRAVETLRKLLSENGFDDERIEELAASYITLWQ